MACNYATPGRCFTQMQNECVGASVLCYINQQWVGGCYFETASRSGVCFDNIFCEGLFLGKFVGGFVRRFLQRGCVWLLF